MWQLDVARHGDLDEVEGLDACRLAEVSGSAGRDKGDTVRVTTVTTPAMSFSGQATSRAVPFGRSARLNLLPPLILPRQRA